MRPNTKLGGAGMSAESGAEEVGGDICLTRASVANLMTRLMNDREPLFTEIVEENGISHKIKCLVLVSVTLLAFYGVSMGIYNGLLQALVAMVKVPLLFYLTLVVCYPLLYVFNVLFGSRMGFASTLALILASMAMSSVILGAFAPIALFFVFSKSDYAFMKLLHVFTVGTAAVIGMVCMYRGLVVVCEKHKIYPKSAINILRVWLAVFAFVGTQMVWNLRPLGGNRDQPFELIRSNREGNFYKSVVVSVRDLFSDD